MDISIGKKIAQEKNASRGVVRANPVGDLIFVDSVNGNDGFSGESRRHAVQTLTRALALAEAGDTIILNAGGSETVTATLAVSLARLRIICETENPESGFTISGAGTLDLMTVSAADVTIKGIKFAHTGAASTKAGILTTATADRLHVENCLFDDSAIATDFTGYGIEITNAVQGIRVINCVFKDLINGVRYTIATGVVQVGSRIQGCVFHVGKAAAFGVLTALTGTGAVRGLEVIACVFMEANGDGSAATAAWDGATQGPLSFGAAVDQYLVSDCRAYTALARHFEGLNVVTAGALGDFANNKTGEGGAEAGSVFVVKKTLVSSAILQAGVDITGVSSIGELVLEDVVLQTDGTGLAAATNLNIETNNVKGAAIAMATAVSGLGANATIDLERASVSKKHVVLEVGKKFIAKATAADCTGAGTIDIWLVLRRVVANAFIAAA